MHLHSLGLWLQGRSTVCLPLGVGKAQSTKTVKLEILHRFEYDSKMLMSGVIAKADTSKSERAQVLIKGAPYEVTQLADPDSLPKDWAQVRCTHRMLTKTATSCLNLHVCCCDLCLPFCIQTCVYLLAYRLWTENLLLTNDRACNDELPLLFRTKLLSKTFVCSYLVHKQLLCLATSSLLNTAVQCTSQHIRHCLLTGQCTPMPLTYATTARRLFAIGQRLATEC